MRKLPISTMIHYLRVILETHLFQRFRQNKKMTKPLVAIFQPTMRCNFKCTYCDDGSGIMYPLMPEKNRASTEDTKIILDQIRKVSAAITVSGGEVTLRSDIVDLFAYIDKIGFSPVGLNTNAYLLDKYIKVLHHIDYLIISLDSLDLSRMDTLINLGSSGHTKKVLDNIALAISYKKKHKLKFNIVINTVIFPETINDAWDVFEFCIQNDLFWSPMPHIHGKYPNPALVDHPGYEELIDEVIRVKKQGGKLFGTTKGFKILKKFERYECYPTSRATVFPNGDLFYPCAPLGNRAGNLLKDHGYHAAMKKGEKAFGLLPDCDARCHINCYLEGSLMISHPLLGIKEALSFMSLHKKKITLQRPPEVKSDTLPPGYKRLRLMPALPIDTVRKLRAQGAFINDFTSRIEIAMTHKNFFIKESKECQQTKEINYV